MGWRAGLSYKTPGVFEEPVLGIGREKAQSGSNCDASSSERATNGKKNLKRGNCCTRKVCSGSKRQRCRRSAQELIDWLPKLAQRCEVERNTWRLERGKVENHETLLDSTRQEA